MKEIGNISLIFGSHIQFLEKLGEILEIKNFKEKAKVKSVEKIHSLYISIKEDRYYARIISKEWHDKSYRYANGPIDISEMSLGEIQSFELHISDQYVLPWTVKTFECEKTQTCPDCSDGKCDVCSGKGKVRCDACEGSKECSSCNGTGQYPCYSCHQSGECRNCHGSGKVDCEHCDGDGWVWDECRACHGTGEYYPVNGAPRKCRACNGTGNHHKEPCHWCYGSGKEACEECDGSGECYKCEGDGHVECRACHGSGRCGKCKGKGKLRCRNCSGSGLCPKCHGTEVTTCNRCLGSGFYQTFDVVDLDYEENNIILKDETLEKKLEIDFESLSKRGIYYGTPYLIDFGKASIEDEELIDVIRKSNKTVFIPKIEQYRNGVVNDAGTLLIPQTEYLKSTISVEHIPVIRYTIEYSKKVFIFYVVGWDGLVLADKTPNLWDKFCTLFH